MHDPASGACARADGTEHSHFRRVVPTRFVPFVWRENHLGIAHFADAHYLHIRHSSNESRQPAAPRPSLVGR